MRYDIAILGNYTKDTIVSPTGTRHVDGGGFNYGAHVASRLGLKTAAVTRLAREDIRVVRALEGLGIDVYPTYTPDSTIMRLFYPTTDVDVRTLTVTKTAGSFTPEQVAGLEARAFLVNASARGEVGMDVILELKRKTGSLLVVDAQGYIRVIAPDGTLKFEDWPGKKDLLAQVDILKTDAVEARALTGLSDKRAAARELASWGPNEIVLTDKDEVISLAGGKFSAAPFLPEKLVGRSGRGDTCIASYVARRLSASPEEATVWAAAATSLKLETEGPFRGSAGDVEEMIAKKYGLPSRPNRRP